MHTCFPQAPPLACWKRAVRQPKNAAFVDVSWPPRTAPTEFLPRLSRQEPVFMRKPLTFRFPRAVTFVAMYGPQHTLERKFEAAVRAVFEICEGEAPLTTVDEHERESGEPNTTADTFSSMSCNPQAANKSFGLKANNTGIPAPVGKRREHRSKAVHTGMHVPAMWNKANTYSTSFTAKSFGTSPAARRVSDGSFPSRDSRKSPASASSAAASPATGTMKGLVDYESDETTGTITTEQPQSALSPAGGAQASNSQEQARQGGASCPRSVAVKALCTPANKAAFDKIQGATVAPSLLVVREHAKQKYCGPCVVEAAEVRRL